MKKILIVEDDFIIRMFFTQIINKNGGKVIGVLNNCDNILEVLTDLKPDIIFMDIAIDGNLDGIDATQLINVNTKIPVVYVTGNSDKKTMDRAKSTNPFHIIKKPIDEEKLKEQLTLIYNKFNSINKY